MTTETTYNGWTNYATWRINLDLINDDERWAERAEEVRTEGEGEIDAYDFGKEIKEATEELVGELAGVKYGESNIALDYALAFMSDVDWTSIAEHIIADLEPYIAETDDEE
jgi:hypothetical protein